MKVEPFDTQRQQSFTRRSAIASGGMAVLFGGIVYRLYDLQVRRHEEFQAKADDNRFKQRIVVPLRGEILDRYGEVVATNRQNFRVLLIPEETPDLTQSIAAFESVVPLSATQQRRLLREIQEKADQPFTPVEVIDHLEWEDFVKVNFHGPELPGIVPEVGDTRFYPGGEAIGPVVGHVGAADRRDLDRAADQAERLLYLQPGYKLGKLGLELTHNEALRGTPGFKTLEINAAGRVIDENDQRSQGSVQGEQLALTLDADLQRRAHEILSTDYGEYPEGTEGPGAFSGSAVVLDTRTGDVLVMASAPSFDPNLFARRIDTEALRSLERSPLKPMLCKPLAGAYPPGSTFKLLTIIAAEEAGIASDQRFFCNGSFRFGSRTHGCWKRSGHGWMDMRASVKHSCDVYFYNLATRLDIDHIADVAKRYGLGQTYDLGIGGELRGIVPSREWKRDFYRTNPENQTWFPGETLSVAIGQGATTATPLQLAVMAARLATGRMVKPRIVRGIGEDIRRAEFFPETVTSREMLDVVRDGMDQVVNEWGTAARSSLMPDYRMAGKTGTSQVRSLRIDPETGRPVPNEELPWNERDHALFVCFAPFDEPRYACSVVVDHGGSGSKAAGPRARDIMRAVLEKDPGNQERHELWQPGREPIRPWLTAQASGPARQGS